MTPQAGRRCTVCSHESVIEIQKLMTRGEPLSALAFRFDLQKSSLSRHSKNCMGRAVRPYAKTGSPSKERTGRASPVKTRSATGDELSPEALKQRALNLLETGERIMATAEDANDLRLCLAAHDRTQRALEMLCRVAGLLGPDVQVNIDQRQVNQFAGWSTPALQAIQIMADELAAGRSVEDAVHAVLGAKESAPALPPGREESEAA